MATIKGLEESKEAAVAKAIYDTRMEMQSVIDKAYDKGYTRCEESMKRSMDMLKAMKD